VLPATMTGCGSGLFAGTRSGDTTAIATAVAESDWRGMSEVEVPGDAIDPQLAGKTFRFKINGGKNITVDAWYDNGQQKFHVASDRSTNIDKLFGGAMGMDAQKFDQERNF